MKRLTLAASLVLAVALPAQAHALTHREAVAYGRAYWHAARTLGMRTAGCKLIGPTPTCAGHPADARILHSTDVLRRMVAPHRTQPISSSTTSTTSTAAVSYSGGYSIPSYIVQCESGGDWHAVNPSSGAGGAYQLLPSTSVAYGGTATPQDMSPAQQSAVAARVWAASGASAWSCG